MIDWLAVIVFCIGGECRFWADTKTPYETKEKCEAKVVEMYKYLQENDGNPAMGGCLPIRFTRV